MSIAVKIVIPAVHEVAIAPMGRITGGEIPTQVAVVPPPVAVGVNATSAIVPMSGVVGRAVRPIDAGVTVAHSEPVIAIGVNTSRAGFPGVGIDGIAVEGVIAAVAVGVGLAGVSAQGVFVEIGQTVGVGI